MKLKLLVTTLTLFISSVFTAQNCVPNASFETWSVNSFFGNLPNGWMGFNVTKQNSGAKDGNSYARIENTSTGQGSLMLGTSTAAAFKMGAPCTENITSIQGFYKTSGLGTNDAVGVSAFTSKSGQVKAIGSFTTNANVSSWTAFSIVMIGFGGPNTSIDTLNIMASSSNITNGQNNSLSATLDIDNLTLTTIVGIHENPANAAFNVYPNPAVNELNIVSKDENAVSVKITNVNGSILKSGVLEMPATKVDLDDYSSGIYFYTISDKNNGILHTGKFIVNK